ncbi:MAG: hypothetical protein JNK21_02010, partial [Rhodospirillaceae bacterium]|nr:hypothetical protein [Rhodospirillaceae bacterium]
MKKFGASVSMLVLLAACAAPQPPKVNVPAQFIMAPDEMATVDMAGGVWPSATWWTSFENSELSALIDTAAANNRNLKAAAARILQAEAQAKSAG